MEINALEIFKKVYPIGSIYLSVNDVNPSSYFGGTWVAWGSGRVPIGVDTSDTNFNEVEKTGGEKSHTISTNEMPKHTHSWSGTTNSTGAHTHSISITTSNNGSHTHTYSGTTGGRVTAPGNKNTEFGNGVKWVGGTSAAIAYANKASEYAQNSWRDIANEHGHKYSGTTSSSGGHTHSVSGNTGSNGAHTHTISGTTGSTGSGTAMNILQPYITCYMWKRTA